MDPNEIGYRDPLWLWNATFLSVCAGESQAGNPIGSALVFAMTNIANMHAGYMQESNIITALISKKSHPAKSIHIKALLIKDRVTYTLSQTTKKYSYDTALRCVPYFRLHYIKTGKSVTKNDNLWSSHAKTQLTSRAFNAQNFNSKSLSKNLENCIRFVRYIIAQWNCWHWSCLSNGIVANLIKLKYALQTAITLTDLIPVDQVAISPLVLYNMPVSNLSKWTVSLWAQMNSSLIWTIVYR